MSAAAMAPRLSRAYKMYEPKNAVPVCAAAKANAHLAPASRAVAAMAETQGEHVMIKKMKATAEGALMAAVRSAP